MSHRNEAGRIVFPKPTHRISPNDETHTWILTEIETEKILGEYGSMKEAWEAVLELKELKKKAEEGQG